MYTYLGIQQPFLWSFVSVPQNSSQTPLLSHISCVPFSMKLFTPWSFKTSSQRIAVDFTWATSSWTFNSCSPPAKVHWTVFGSWLRSGSCGREEAEFPANRNPLLMPVPKCIYLKSNDKWTQSALWSVDHAHVVYIVHSYSSWLGTTWVMFMLHCE